MTSHVTQLEKIMKSHMDLSHGQKRLPCERCGKILTSARAQEIKEKEQQIKGNHLMFRYRSACL